MPTDRTGQLGTRGRDGGGAVARGHRHPAGADGRQARLPADGPDGLASRLITVAHGTRLADGNEVARAITIQAARRLGCVPSAAAYVELARPLIADEMAQNEGPAIVVPLLLSTGYHVRHDLPRAMLQSPVPVRMARPLGPHPLLADAMCWRLRAAGAQLGDPVVMVAAGSNDPASEADLAEAGRLLAGRWGGPVRVTTVGGLGTPAVEAIRAFGNSREFGSSRVAVAPYLLAPGHFAKRVQVIARSAGVGTVAEVLGAHPLVVEVVCRRYRTVVAAASRSAAA